MSTQSTSQRRSARPVGRHLSRLQFLLWVLALPLILIQLDAQDTAYPPVDAQIPGPASPRDFRAWLADLQHWRRERLVRMGYDGSNYARPELQWTQHNFACVQMMVEERDFFDRARAAYTVDRYLDRLDKEFGGIDSVLVWDTYPNLGVDNRNQFDRLRDLPGGIDGVKQMVADFHRHGVRVLFPETPWDLGTRDEGVSDWTAQADLMAQIGADGVLGDTMDGVPHAFLWASEKVGHPLGLQPEGLPAEEALAWNEMSWGYWSYPFVPMVSRYKWLETRHMPVLTSGGRHHLDGIQAAFFNGVGYADQQNVIGFHNASTARELEALRRTRKIDLAMAKLLVSTGWEPHTPTLQYGVFSSKFPGLTQTLWTLVNRNQYGVKGNQIIVSFSAGLHYFDLWHGVELIPQILPGNPPTAVLNFEIEGLGFGAVLSTPADAFSPQLTSLLAEMRTLAQTKLVDFSDEWSFLPQHRTEVAATQRASQAPNGMVLIPGGDFDFKVEGLEVAGGEELGVDVQYPWEEAPHRHHDRHLNIPTFYIDRFPVTNSQFKQFTEFRKVSPQGRSQFPP